MHWTQKKILSTSYKSGTGYAIELSSKCTEITKKVRLKFPFCPEKKLIRVCEKTDNIKTTPLKNYYTIKKLIYDPSN